LGGYTSEFSNQICVIREFGRAIVKVRKFLIFNMPDFSRVFVQGYLLNATILALFAIGDKRPPDLNLSGLSYPNLAA